MTKNSFCMDVGRRIATTRNQLHLTQQQVAEAAGISISYYSQIENGNKTLSSYVLAHIVSALGTSSDYILFGIRPSEKDPLQRLLSSASDQERRYFRSILELCQKELMAAEVLKKANAAIHTSSEDRRD